ncbi:ATP-binding protein [Burkholderia gladioli]|uniref:ATP-binding protein n=1 Tax=Burkholderia gladioli TaxID=28095 RepID=UPI0016423230|nr:ATP-binding protein [Burkholderia gladioli]
MSSRSIRRGATLLALGCVGTVWLLAVFGCLHLVDREIEEWQDARLAEYADFLLRLDAPDLARFARAPVDARVELPRAGEPPGTERDGDKLPRQVFFEVRDAGDRVLASNLPPEAAAATLAPGYGQPPAPMRMRGIEWRSFASREAGSGRSIRVMETANTRSDLAARVARGIVWPLGAALPVLALLIWYAIGRGLTPLTALSTAIAARDARSLDPIGAAAVPREVEVLVDAIDRLLDRLRTSIARERTFTADAAHELKTPLAAIKIQAQLAFAFENAALRQQALQRVIQGVDRGARLAEQLLLLARLDEYERIPSLAVAVAPLIDAAVTRHAESAADRDTRIEVDCEAGLSAHADPVLFGILLDNLLDNAIKYGTRGGRIRVSMQRQNARRRLSVSDDGPGVQPDEYPRLTDRFYRGLGAQSPGSGLGLSIVARIAHYLGARLWFEPGLDGRGLSVLVELDVASPDDALQRDKGLNVSLSIPH